jgi:hypothetical protein
MDYSVNRPAAPTNMDQIEDDAPTDDDFNYGAAATTAPEDSYFASTSWRSGQSSSDSLSYDAPAISAPEMAYLAEDKQKSQMPRSIRDLGQILNSKRRAAVQQTIRGAATAWIDQDDSGTYDPKADRATPPVTPPRRAKKPKLIDELNKDGNQRPQMSRPTR